MLDFAEDQMITRWATGSFKGESKADISFGFYNRDSSLYFLIGTGVEVLGSIIFADQKNREDD